MAKRERVHGEGTDIPGPVDNWNLTDVLNIDRARDSFQDEVSQDFAAEYPWYESRNVQGE